MDVHSNNQSVLTYSGDASVATNNDGVCRELQNGDLTK